MQYVKHTLSRSPQIHFIIGSEIMLVPFHEHFPEVAKAETRSVTILKGSPSGLPPDEYAFLELYCNDPGCDCRRVRFCVISRTLQKPIAHVDYGWESQAYYNKWLRGVDLELAGEMADATLDPMQKHSNFAPAILTFVKETLLQDSEYIARLKRHYQMMRDKFNGRSAKLSKTDRKKRTKQRERLLQEKKREKRVSQRKDRTVQKVKLAYIMEKMANHVLRPSFSDSAENMAILLSSLAWNQANGANLNADSLYSTIEESNREDPTLWNDLIDSNVEVLLDKLKEYKQKNYPDDDRVILGMSSQEHPDDPDAWRLVVASVSKNEFENLQSGEKSFTAEDVNNLMETYRG